MPRRSAGEHSSGRLPRTSAPLWFSTIPSVADILSNTLLFYHNLYKMSIVKTHFFLPFPPFSLCNLQIEATNAIRGAAAPKVAFSRKKPSQNLLGEGVAIPTRFAPISFDRPPTPRPEAIQVIFGDSFRKAKRIPQVREKYGQKKACFLLPVFLSDWRRSQSFSAKNDAKYSCPPRKVFAELFSKSDPSPAGAPRQI